ncbi:hypothetical protein C2845_PM11G12350 [Panicum miliaceum]|uniref:DUF1618 domain-containing protein n=1 Tax=Panicum miliaceum TaxID=4540 RepID=A0A3L6RNC0_PANMI|nr:hypothetical protein C2845_PM11G12350 [Panicum miliaceum]
MSAGGGFPNWLRLETVVLRRDKDKAFPDEINAPIGACGFTSWGAFSFAEPPRVSHLFAQLPDFPKKELALAIVGTHRHLALFRVGTHSSPQGTAQEFFIYDASAIDDPFSLKPLPPCTLPHLDYTGRLPHRRHSGASAASTSSGGASAKRGLLAVKSMGLLCRGSEEQLEFVVAELQLFKPSISEVYADIFLLKSDRHGPGKWRSTRVPILCSDDPDDLWQLCLWQTDAVVPVGDRWLCWVDYYRGILFCNVFAERDPTVCFIRFPLQTFPDTHNRSIACSWLYRVVSVIDAGRALKFVDVARYDDIGYGALKPGTGFTITCHRRQQGVVEQGLHIFPQVDIDRPHIVHFIVTDFVYVMKKMWLVAIDISTRTVESCLQYTNGLDDVGTEGEYLTNVRSRLPMPFLHCEFSKYVHPER